MGINSAKGNRVLSLLHILELKTELQWEDVSGDALLDSAANMGAKLGPIFVHSKLEHFSLSLGKLRWGFGLPLK